MKLREMLLDRLLQALVDEWGREKVAASLAHISGSTNGPLSKTAHASRLQTSGRREKPSATSRIEGSAGLDGERKDVLLQLARRYDHKQFLPSVADVREFLVMMGERPVGMKDRKDAFRALLPSLMQLPVDRLRQVANAALHSGPSQLGPLSDAISAAGEHLPRQRESQPE